MRHSDRTPPSDWETERDDEFQQESRGTVIAYDGTVYPDPSKNTIRFSNKIQYLRFLHHKTGRPLDELWSEYEEKMVKNE